MSINGSLCTNVTVDPSLVFLTCLAPPGAGTSFTEVVVEQLSGTTVFTYSPPRVTSVSQSPVDAASEVAIIVRAKGSGVGVGGGGGGGWCVGVYGV